MDLTDLPSEILCDIFRLFDSLHTFKALSQTCTRFKYLLSELMVVICDDEEEISSKRNFDLGNITHVNISKISINALVGLMRKYHYFIFNFSTKDTQNVTDQIKILKIVLRNLQMAKMHHTVYINSKNFNMNPLMRFLLPKLNSPFTEFYFPLVKKIEGFEDLRLLDNTNCYFSQLKELIIGSLSFQLFNLTAPRLEVFNHSKVILTRTFNENVSTAKISYSKFLDNLMCNSLDCLEVIGSVNHSTLYKFSSVKILRIYADNTSQSFDLEKFVNLEELVISKCSKLSHLVNLSGVGECLKYLDLSNNKNYNQIITGNFKKLRKIDLSNTGIHEVPQIDLLDTSRELSINTEGCRNLPKGI